MALRPLSTLVRRRLHEGGFRPLTAGERGAFDLVATWGDSGPRGVGGRPTPRSAPVFARVGPEPTVALAQALATAFFGVDTEVVRDDPSVVRVEGAGVAAEIDRWTGQLWVADEARVFGREEEIDRLPTADAVDVATTTASTLWRLLGHGHHPRFERVLSHLGGTWSQGTDPRTGRTRRERLNTRVHFGDLLLDPDHPRGRAIPVYLQGALAITVDPRGRLAGISGSIYQPERVLGEVELVEGRGVIARLDRAAKRARIVRTRLKLVYTATVDKEGVPRLEPSWLTQVEVSRGDGRVSPLRPLFLSATGSGPMLLPGATRAPSAPLPVVLSTQSFKAGTEWVDPIPGLSWAPTNTDDFMKGLPSGWQKVFQRGEGASLTTDWEDQDDSFVDVADIVYYAGHADPWGWELSDDWTNITTLPSSGSSLKWWGDKNLGWLVIGACGPLQPKGVDGATDEAETRWKPRFKGLRSLMGYASLSADVPEEGAKFIKYAKYSSYSLIDAWFRAATEAQPGKIGNTEVKVAALYAKTSSTSALSDKLPGISSAPGSAALTGTLTLKIKSQSC